MLFPHSVKKKKSCVGILFALVLYSLILILIFEYTTNDTFRQNVNTGVTGVVSRTGEYISSLKETDGPAFSLKGLWAAVSGSDISGRTSDSKNAFAGSTCNTRDQMVSTLKEQTETKPSSATLELSNLMYQKSDDAEWVTELIYDAGFSYAAWIRQQSGESYSITFTEIEYSDAVPCTTLARFETLLKGAEDKKSISIRPSAALYEQLKENDWALVYATEGKLGITEASFSFFGEPYRVLVFSGLVFEPNFYRASSPEQVTQFFSESSRRGDTSIAFYCDNEALFHALTEEDAAYSTAVISMLEENCGIYNGHFYFDETKNLLYSSQLDYYPGARIVMLAKTGRLNQLTSRERTLYDCALSMANRCRSISGSDYELVMNICTELAGGSEYLYCETESCPGDCDRDTAYGVLMTGGGECDSYADAFYLVANLAGLEVGYQYGKIREEYSGSTGVSSHIWNTVTFGSDTFFLDMTWADADANGCLLHPYWILTGRDLAAHTHIWNEETALRPITALTSKNYFPYYHNNAAFGNVSDACDYIRSHENNGQAYIQLMLINQGNISNDDLLHQMFSCMGVSGSYSYRFIDKYIFLTYFY